MNYRINFPPMPSGGIVTPGSDGARIKQITFIKCRERGGSLMVNRGIVYERVLVYLKVVFDGEWVLFHMYFANVNRDPVPLASGVTPARSRSDPQEA
jgi:hypothetical protein